MNHTPLKEDRDSSINFLSNSTTLNQDDFEKNMKCLYKTYKKVPILIKISH